MDSVAIREQIRARLVKQEQPSALPIEQQRKEWEESASQLPPLPGISVENVIANGAPGIIVAPNEPASADLILYVHGGGFILGSPKTHQNLAARIARSTKARALVIDYRLAPENRFPAAREDVLAAYQWAHESGYDASSIVIAGDSAGAHIALTAVLQMRDERRPMPRALVLMSPWLDLSHSGASMRTLAHAEPLISQADLEDCAKKYLGELSAIDPAVAPLAANLHGLPDLLIHVGEDEILRSDSERLAERARAAGTRVKLRVWPKLWHVFHAWAPELPQANDAIEEIGRFVRR